MSPDVDATKHGIIYEKGCRPQLATGESDLGFPPVEAQFDISGEHLPIESRVNYHGFRNVYHNMNVWLIGQITSESWDTVYDAINHFVIEDFHHGVPRYYETTVTP